MDGALGRLEQGFGAGPFAAVLLDVFLTDRCRDAGLLVGADEDNRLTLFPALIVEREVARQGLDILDRSL